VSVQGAGAAPDTLQVTLAVGASYNLLVSTQPDRGNAQPLDGLSVSGNIYVFTSPVTNVARVQFFLDDPGMTGPPRQVERTAPHDFAGGTVELANPFNASGLAPGAHTITAAIELTTGAVTTVHAQFGVAGTP
jgi:hypothetical protein